MIKSNSHTVFHLCVCVQDVEANTVRLKEHEEDVLVLERSNNRSSSSSPLKYIYLLLSELKTTIENL